MNQPQSNVKPARIAEDAPGLLVLIPDAEELQRLEDTFRARFETYGVLRDSLILAVQRAKADPINGFAIEEAQISVPLPVPIVVGTPDDLVILHNLASAVEMLKMASRTYTVLRAIEKD